MEQVRRRGLIGRVLRSSAAWAGILAMANLACTGTARADVASEMNSFFSDVGGAANVTGPSAFQGQSAGYYSLGNVWTRFPQKSVQPFNLQLPSARAGCRSEEHTSELQSLMRISYAVFCLKKKTKYAAQKTNENS